jgi:hypothetical protein
MPKAQTPTTNEDILSNWNSDGIRDNTWYIGYSQSYGGYVK